MTTSEELYLKTAQKISKLITNQYSTSFSLGILLFSKRIRCAIYAIYGFVRTADEIVDTFHEHDKRRLLMALHEDACEAIQSGISFNPVIYAFQDVVRTYDIDRAHIDAFFASMEMDLACIRHTPETFKQYIHGSAEVIGLMCLKVFCNRDTVLFESLTPQAKLLGSAMQKVNFLRDIKSDLVLRRRIYLPGIHSKEEITDAVKKALEDEVEAELRDALNGIKRLPGSARVGVYCAYLYYCALLEKLRNTTVEQLFSKRVRISDARKILLLVRAYVIARFRF